MVVVVLLGEAALAPMGFLLARRGFCLTGFDGGCGGGSAPSSSSNSGSAGRAVQVARTR